MTSSPQPANRWPSPSAGNRRVTATSADRYVASAAAGGGRNGGRERHGGYSPPFGCRVRVPPRTRTVLAGWMGRSSGPFLRTTKIIYGAGIQAGCSSNGQCRGTGRRAQVDHAPRIQADFRRRSCFSADQLWDRGEHGLPLVTGPEDERPHRGRSAHRALAWLTQRDADRPLQPKPSPARSLADDLPKHAYCRRRLSLDPPTRCGP
jgi:hypothetical protein